MKFHWLIVVLSLAPALSHADVKMMTCLSFSDAQTGLLEQGASRKDVFVFDTADFAKARGELTHTMAIRNELSPAQIEELRSLGRPTEREETKVSKFSATPTHLIVEEAGVYGPMYIKVNRSTLMVDMYGEWLNPKPCTIEDYKAPKENVF